MNPIEAMRLGGMLHACVGMVFSSLFSSMENMPTQAWAMAPDPGALWERKGNTLKRG
jgi:hypothetical protein